MKIILDSLEEVKALAAALGVTEITEEPVKAKRKSKKAEEPKAEEAKTEEPKTEEKPESEEPKVEVPSLKEVRDKLIAYKAKKGAAEAKALILKHGASRVSEIPEENRADFIAEADAVLNGDEDGEEE